MSELTVRSYLVLALSLILSEHVYSQVDSSDVSFFPSAIGNVWRYQAGPDSNSSSQTRLQRDSIAKGRRYLFFDSSTTPLYSIDSTGLNVTFNPLSPYAWLVYKLDAKANETWTVSGGSGGRIAGRVDNVYWDFVLGKLTQVKAIGYYTQGSDTSNFSIWLYEDYLAAGFGYYLSIGDAAQSPNMELIGCIIDGVAYGRVTQAMGPPKETVATDFILYPAFPNPFNPVTNVFYSIPKESRASLIVYDLIGRKVATLFDGYRTRGTYSASFAPKGMTSGIYFVRLVAGRYAKTIKIVYSK